MKTPQNDNVPYDLISRYFSGEASVDEIIDVERWKAVSPENANVIEQCRKVWEKTGQSNLFADINLDDEWNSFQKAINHPSHEAEKNIYRQVLIPIYRIAAVIVLGLLLGFSAIYIYNSMKLEKFYAGNSQQVIDLPDESKVFLNKNSRISFDESFDNSREIVLDGEAFFNVVSDPSRPFIVKTGKLRVEVLGTSFNVQGYKKEESVKVIVESGRVAVYEKSNIDAQDVLQKGDKIEYYRKSGERKLSQNQDKNYNSWRTGILSFENSSLEEVLNKLTEIYDVNFQISNRDLYKCRISVKFDNSELEYILNTLSVTLDISFENKNSYFLVRGDGC